MPSRAACSFEAKSETGTCRFVGMTATVCERKAGQMWRENGSSLGRFTLRLKLFLPMPLSGIPGAPSSFGKPCIFDSRVTWRRRRAAMMRLIWIVTSGWRTEMALKRVIGMRASSVSRMAWSVVGRGVEVMQSSSPTDSP